MKTGTLTKLLSACFLMVMGSMTQAADFNCFPASLQLKTTEQIQSLLNEAMPFVVRDGKNRTSTLTGVSSVSSSGCNIEVKFTAKLERRKKAIKKKRTVKGSAILKAEVGRFNGCLQSPEFSKLEYDDTTRITENLIRNFYNRKLPDQLCPSSDGSINF